MTLQGDDCYFFYYSTCTKGDSCPFRHCEAAMGSETVCNLWQEQRCFRNVCKFRHMEIDKNRKEIACYWENQPAGCQKPHCAFHHEKPRIINGNYLAPDKGQVARKDNEEAPLEEKVNQVPAPSANPTNPQLRGVKRTETQENVPSPTHPPVVINPVDDDDEDDQFSEEGDESLGVSPRKLVSSKHDSLDFGIQTLEEIRLRKALMSNLKKARQSTVQGLAQISRPTVEKENIQSLSRLEVNNVKIDSSGKEVGKRRIADRLGKRILERDVPGEEGPPLKRSLAERLGGVVESSTDVLTNKSHKPVHERLGLTTDMSSGDSEPKSSGDIRIKTLEEIRQEKAAKNLSKSKVVRVVKEVPQKEISPSKKSVKPVAGPQVKTFSEILHEKKRKMQEKKEQEINKADKSPERSEEPSSARAANKTTVTTGEVRVKTLEEIRREKAARMQTQLGETTDNKTPTSSEAELSGPSKRRILRINKTSPAAVTQTKPDASEKKPEPATEANGKIEPSSEVVKVKTFEEIMREKRLRKLQEEQVTSSNQKDVGASESPPAPEPSVQPQTTVRQRITFKAKPSPPVSDAVVIEKSSPERSEDSTPSTNTTKPSTSPVRPVRIAEGIVTPAETKVRPKVNVKPSVVKPAAPSVQKRKAAKVHSAVAEVKPLNTTCQTPSSPVMPNKRLKMASPTSKKVVQSDTQQVPSNIENIQMMPVSCSEPASTTSVETVVVPHSPVIKTPSMQRSRRCSTTSGRPPVVTSSSMDDFEDLLDEFTDDRLEDELELDSGKGEDDLLLELSEMIDS